MSAKNPLTVSQGLDEDEGYDASLRPKSLSEYIGQEKIQENLSVFIEAAKQFGIEVNLLSGPEYTATWKSQYDEMGNALRALGLAEK